MGRLPTIRTRSKNLRGHYIGFRKIDDQWFRFDDRVVHRVNIMWEYSVNLVVYQRNDTPVFMTAVDLSVIPQLQKAVVLNCRNSGGNGNDKQTNKQTSLQRPPLITPSTNDGNTVQSPENLPSIEKPQRVQPYQWNKDYVVCYAPDSTSSSEKGREFRTNSDTNYIPPKSTGTFWPNISNLSSHQMLLQSSIEAV